MLLSKQEKGGLTIRLFSYMEIVQENSKNLGLGLYTDFYVYAYFDRRRKGDFKYGEYIFEYEPIYIGRGIRNRIYHHIREAKGERKLRGRINWLKINKIRKIIEETKVGPIIAVLEKGLSLKEASEKEEQLIKLIGRIDLKSGPLTNLTFGGDGGLGMVLSEESKNKIRMAHLGKKDSDLVRKKKSIASTGRRHTPKSIAKMCRVQKGHIVTTSTREKLKRANIGKKASEESRNKMSLARLGKKRGIAFSEKMKEARTEYAYSALSQEGVEFSDFNLNDFCKEKSFSRRTVLRKMNTNVWYKGWLFFRELKNEKSNFSGLNGSPNKRSC